MSVRSVLILLRFPFSWLLLPIALLACVLAPQPQLWRGLVILGILHLLIYPASNGFNSWCDKDTGPIGGVAQPPQATRGLLISTFVLDILALVLGLVISWGFSLGLLVYILASRAYSWRRLRLKSKPILSLVLVALGQGGLTFWLVRWQVQALPGPIPTDPGTLLCTLAAALFLAGMYPLGQIYQHQADQTQGDLTWSRFVGIRGTFISSSIFLSLALGTLAIIFAQRFGLVSSLFFALSTLPAAIFFLIWAIKTWTKPALANWKNVMIISVLASTGLNFFLILKAVVF